MGASASAAAPTAARDAWDPRDASADGRSSVRDTTSAGNDGAGGVDADIDAGAADAGTTADGDGDDDGYQPPTDPVSRSDSSPSADDGTDEQ